MSAVSAEPYSACPHYDGEAMRRPTYHRLVGEGVLRAGYAAEDGVGLHFVGTELREAVASRRGKRAYSVDRGADDVAVEAPVPTRYLDN